jgi:hypothetical protein
MISPIPPVIIPEALPRRRDAEDHARRMGIFRSCLRKASQIFKALTMKSPYISFGLKGLP